MPEEDRRVRFINPGKADLPFQRKVRLTEEKRKALGEELSKLYSDFDSSSTLFRSQLLRWVNNSEGIGEPSTFMWTGSSDLYKPISETRMNIFHSFFMSTIRPRQGRLFVCYTDNILDKEEVDIASNITHYFNNNRDFNRMYVANLAESTWASPRDGTVGRSVDWLQKVDHRWETVRYNDTVKFLQKFPTAKVADMSEDSYQQTIEKLSSGEEVSVDEEFDVVTYDGPWIDTEEVKDVVLYPWSAARQDRSEFLGKRFPLRASELKAREKKGLYSHVDDVVKMRPDRQRDNVSQLQDQIEGISEPQDYKDYLVVHGRWYKDLDGDGVEEKYLVTFVPQTKTILQFDRYPFWHGEDFIQLEVFKRRPKRILGRGICQMLDDINTEANIQSRFRIDSMAITNAPHVVFDEMLKTRLDLNIPANRIRPGGSWWLPSGMLDKGYKILEFPKKNFTEMLREETFLQQNADSLIGASELRSGRETPFDPRSPAAKTQILLQQSSTRMDDFIFDTIMTENRILDMVLRLYYQFGPEQLKVYVQAPPPAPGSLPGAQVQDQGFVEKLIRRSEFGRTSLHLQLTVTSLLDNPEYLRQQWEEVYIRYGPEPMIGNIIETRHEILRNIFENRPEAVGKNIPLPLQEIMQKMAKTHPILPGPGANGKPQTATVSSSGGA